jgi:hypothetical protein
MTLIPESLLTLPIELPKFAVVADLRSTYVLVCLADGGRDDSALVAFV